MSNHKEDSVLSLLERGDFKENKIRVVVQLKPGPYGSFMDLIHNKNKKVSERTNFSSVLEQLIEAILDDRVIILDYKTKE